MTTENVTVLFTDMVGSTALAASVGPQVADELRRHHFGLLRRAVAGAGGVEVKNLGDGLMVVFRAASAALSCAVAMQQAVEVDGRGEAAAVGLRVGLSAGEVEAEDGDFFGEPVVEAARLCARCDSGQILAADVVRLMAGRRSQQVCRPLREIVLKGLAEPVATVEVLWEPLGAQDIELVPLPARLAVRPPVGVVGRSAERAVLADGVKRVAADGGREVVVVSGEAGVGKTTLIGEAARVAFDGGACVLFGHCEEDLASPYQLFGEALGHLVGHVPDDELVAVVGGNGAALAGLLPGLARRLAGLGTSTATDSDTGRYQLFAAVVDVLAALSARRPVVLVLEDLQWADRASLQLLRHVVGSDRPMRLLVVATCRDSELSRSHPMVDTLAELHRLGRVTRVGLGGLDDAGVAAYVEAAGGPTLDDTALVFAGELHRETGGNPFFVGEVLRHLAETGALARDEAGRWTATVAVAEMSLPPSVHAVIGGRVGRLGGDAERVLSLAAVIGRDFDVDLLTTAAGTSDDAVLAVLDAAAASALVRELTDTPGHYSFVHALIQHTLYAQLGPTRQARAHRHIAAALETLCGDRPGPRVGELARHWSAATHPDAVAKALHYTRQAADSALAAFAPGDALGYYAQALDLLARQVDENPRLGLDLTIGLGVAQRQTGHAEFRDTLLGAARQAADLGDTERLAAAALANNRGMFSVAGRVDRERVEILELVIARLPRDHPSRPLLLAKLCSELGTVRSGHRRELAAEAIALARSTGDDATIVRVLNDVSWPLNLPRLLEQSLELSAEAMHRAERLGDAVLLWWGALNRAGICLRAGDIAEMERCYAIAWELAGRLDQPMLSWLRAVHQAMCALLAGNTVEAEALATEARQIGIDGGEPDAPVIFGLQLNEVNIQRGVFPDDAVPLIEHLRSELPEIDEALTAALAAEHARLGRLELAHGLLDEFAAGGFEPAPLPANWLYIMIRYTDVAIACADAGAGASLYERLVPLAGQVPSDLLLLVWPPVDHHLGRLATLLRRYEQADAHFTAAAEFAARAGAAYFAAETDLAWGTMFLQRGDSGDTQRARTRLYSARTVAAARGYADVERRATEMLERLV